MFEKVFLDKNEDYDEQDEKTDADRDNDDHNLRHCPCGHNLILGSEGCHVRKLVVLLDQVDQVVRDNDPGFAGDVDVSLHDQAPCDGDCCAVVIREHREGATMNQSAVGS